MYDKDIISNWPDPKEIYAKIDKLISEPMRMIKPAEMEKILNWFETKCSKSKQIIEQAKSIIPGGVQHNLAFNYPWPIVITKAEGAYMYDIDGNKYIDFLQSGGPTVIGSNPEKIRQKAIEVINETGPSTGLFHEYEYKLAKIICDNMPAVDWFRALGSGTEAVMAALRIARVATGRKNGEVIKVGGDYHGWSDQMVYSLHIPNSYFFEAHGIPKGCYKHTQQVAPNDLEALERKLKKNKFFGRGTAAVIIEPLGPESGTRPQDQEYCKGVEELCKKYGALFILDEVVTGFRMGLAGAQGYFGIKPDITIFGKVVTGGYPAAGGIGGREDLMKYCAAGVQSGVKRAYVGGTLSANPLSCAAGYFTLKEIHESGAAQQATQAGDKITAGIQKLIDDYNLPYVVYNHGSICHLETAAAMFTPLNPKKPWTIPKVVKEASIRKKGMEKFGAAYTAEGIITIAGSRLYTSAVQNDDKLIADALQGFENVFKKVEGVN